MATTNSVYKAFTSDDIVTANPSEVTTGLWIPGDTGSLSSFYTSSAQVATLSGQFYYNIYNVNPDVTSSANIQFAVAYGNVSGSGAPTLTQNSNATLSTLATYFQYKNILLDSGESVFTFANSYVPQHFFVINIERAALRQTLDPGNFQITLSGSGGAYTFIDDSGQTLSATAGKSGNVFNVVMGTLTGPSGSTITSASSATHGGFGLVYPEIGIILLNPDALVEVGACAAPVTSSNVNNQYNHAKLLTSLQLGQSFQARSSEVISSTHYFVRLGNKEFNYSNNPTFSNQTTGALINSDFIQDPHVYPTTIGLYNDNNELLAVAKLSAPQEKMFSSEILLSIRLDW